MTPAADRRAERDRLFEWYSAGPDQAVACDPPGRIATLPGFVSKAGVWVAPIAYVDATEI